MVKHLAHSVNDVRQNGDVDLEEAGERVVEIGHNITQETDGEDGHDAHDELEAVRLALHEQDTEEGEEAETLEKGPPGRIISVHLVT